MCSTFNFGRLLGSRPAARMPVRSSAAGSMVGSGKRALRTELLRQLKTQKEEHRRRKSEAIHRKLYRLAVFRHAKTVMCYVSLPYEVETGRLIAQMLKLGKRVVVPRVFRRSLQLSEVRDPDSDLAPGAYGVLEPAAGRFRPVKREAVDVVVIPGVAFDRRGFRLGHGLGYFDRFLSRLPKATPLVGLCFDFQLLDRVPTETHDRAVHTVLSA